MQEKLTALTPALYDYLAAHNPPPDPVLREGAPAPRLRPGGVIGFDNVLWGGSVADPADRSDDTVALRALNDFPVRDARVDLVMLPVADGLRLVRKR